MQESLQNYLNHLREISQREGYDTPESFINLPSDEENAAKVIKAIKKIKEGNKEHVFKEIVLIGIGGSSLGTKAIYDALNKSSDLRTRIHFIDQINLRKIEETVRILEKENPENCLIIVISKSGETLETRQNYKLLLERLETAEKFKKIFITEKNSKLLQEEKSDYVLTIPGEVGGRFSVFSSVGLVPLALAEIEILGFLKGAMKARKNSLMEENNSALKNALRIRNNYRKGKQIFNIFIFSPELKTLGQWYQQLIGESLGKNKMGLFPVVTEGSKNLHSLQQYFMEGKQNIQHTFLISYNENRYQKATLKAVEKSYIEKGIPYKIISLSTENPEDLGMFMEEKFFEILFLGMLLEVNPFGQPGVESYKSNLEEFLKNEIN